jgi:hypothetical protein
VIARHPRSYEREDFVFDPLHYLALIEQKINALDQAARAAVSPRSACPYSMGPASWRAWSNHQFRACRAPLLPRRRGCVTGPNVGLCARNQGNSRPTVMTANPTLLTHSCQSAAGFGSNAQHSHLLNVIELWPSV